MKEREEGQTEKSRREGGREGQRRVEYVHQELLSHSVCSFLLLRTLVCCHTLTSNGLKTKNNKKTHPDWIRFDIISFNNQSETFWQKTFPEMQLENKLQSNLVSWQNPPKYYSKDTLQYFSVHSSFTVLLITTLVTEHITGHSTIHTVGESAIHLWTNLWTCLVDQALFCSCGVEHRAHGPELFHQNVIIFFVQQGGFLKV